MPRASPESLDSLAQQIATLARSIDKLAHTWLARIREFDACEGWANTGCISMVTWLAWWTGTSRKAASEYVRVARALGRLPQIDAAFAAGELSYSKVRALTRIAEPTQEQSLLDVAKAATASQLDRIVAGLRRVRAHAAAGQCVGERPPRRMIRFTPTADGMVRISGQLGPEEALILQRAIEAAQAPGESPAGDSRAQSPAQSPAGDFGGQSPAGSPAQSAAGDSGAESPAQSPARPRAESPAGDPPDRACDDADALVSVARGYLERKGTTRGSGFELLMVTTPLQLAGGQAGVGGFLRDGTPIPLPIAQMLACDAHRVDVSVHASGQVLDVGRSRRTIPTAIARALALRDGVCRVPGCDRSRHLHAHHVAAWAEGGATAIDNLVLLCTGHHWAVHEGRLRIEARDGELEFRNAYGLPLQSAPHHAIDIEMLDKIIASAGPAGDEPIYAGLHGDGQRMQLAEVIDWMMLAPGFHA